MALGPVGVAAKEKYTVPVVKSTFRILEQLSRAKSLGLNEVAQRTGVAKSTVFRILATLLNMGYVTRDSNRNYLVSSTLNHLVNDEANSEALRSLALPYMLRLRDEYGETINLGTRHFDKVTYLEVVPSEHALRLHERRGATVSAHASALGKAILAFSPPNVTEDLVRGRTLEIITQNTIVDPSEFLDEIRRVRERGYAFDRGEDSLQATCIGAPIIDSHGLAVAALSISGPTSRFNPRKDSPVIGSLLQVTAELSGQLGQLLSGTNEIEPKPATRKRRSNGNPKNPRSA